MDNNLDNLLEILKVQIEYVCQHYRELEENEGEEEALENMARATISYLSAAENEKVLFGAPAFDTHIVCWSFPIAALLLDLEDGNEVLKKGVDGIWELADKQ